MTETETDEINGLQVDIRRARDIKKRTRQVKALTKHLSRLARKGWKIETVEVNVEDEHGCGKI